MPNYLHVDGESWRLPKDADPTGVSASLYKAMKSGTIAVVKAELGDDPRGQVDLFVNGKVLGRFAIVATPDVG